MTPFNDARSFAPLRALLILVAILAGLGAATAQEVAATEPLEIASKGTRHSFSVEVMRDDESRSRGLMFRRSMPPEHGMLFDFRKVERVAMWMKNTYLPLDMLFIRPDGSIARIATNTEPLSTKVIPSGEPVLAVLELNAGTTAKLGIKAGDRVEHAMFGSR
ncbi:DUF192 domain-containing protein [Methylobacterium sp. Leaf93]|uniref:DUF192 domain-containing protein n=1 Tax=Methylobacterium sp. Leaf93 TaxID=1736249 RepID=UPI0006F47E7B|nr:DUF192 domain-containing protein [Methylobacterium sp. Leaf93]KQP05394.1 hypothetical protein ASF26_08070 [Methylobacterium sp. Leaf93]